MDFRVAADRLRRNPHVATDLALAVPRAFARAFARASEEALTHVHARQDLRSRPVVPGRLAMHTRHDADAKVRDTLPSRADLRHRPDLYAGMAMLAGCTADSGTAAAPSATTTRAAAPGFATVRLPGRDTYKLARRPLITPSHRGADDVLGGAPCQNRKPSISMRCSMSRAMKS
jgi:hypothetical protein